MSASKRELLKAEIFDLRGQLDNADHREVDLKDRLAVMTAERDRLALKCDQYQRQLDDKWAGVVGVVNKAVEDLKRMTAELDEWRSGAHADETGHMHACAKVNGQWCCHPGCAVAERDRLRVELANLRRQVQSVCQQCGYVSVLAPRWPKLPGGWGVRVQAPNLLLCPSCSFAVKFNR